MFKYSLEVENDQKKAQNIDEKLVPAGQDFLNEFEELSAEVW
jgi:hypothetical protein